MANAPILPVVQWFGHGLGQVGSYWKAGISGPFVCTPAIAAIATATAAAPTRFVQNMSGSFVAWIIIGGFSGTSRHHIGADLPASAEGYGVVAPERVARRRAGWPETSWNI